VGLPVSIDFFHQFLGVVLGCHGNLDFHLLLGIGVGFDVGAVNKYRLGRKVSRLRHFLQDPTEDMVYRLLGKSVTEIIAHCGKMGRFLLQGIPQKPAVINTAAYLFRRPPEGWQPIQVLDQYHLEQHHWVYARSAIVLAVQWLHHLVQPAKIHCLVYFPQQMLLWHQAIYSYYLYYMTVHFPTFQHLFHHLLLILPLINEKAQLLLDFFDRLSPIKHRLYRAFMDIRSS